MILDDDFSSHGADAIEQLPFIGNGKTTQQKEGSEQNRAMLHGG
jgi:hypothetical protein